MDDIEILTPTERLLLMAAAVHGLGPNTDLSRANTAKVIGQALQWRTWRTMRWAGNGLRWETTRLSIKSTRR